MFAAAGFCVDMITQSSRALLRAACPCPWGFQTDMVALGQRLPNSLLARLRRQGSSLTCLQQQGSALTRLCPIQGAKVPF